MFTNIFTHLMRKDKGPLQPPQEKELIGGRANILAKVRQVATRLEKLESFCPPSQFFSHLKSSYIKKKKKKAIKPFFLRAVPPLRFFCCFVFLSDRLALNQQPPDWPAWCSTCAAERSSLLPSLSSLQEQASFASLLHILALPSLFCPFWPRTLYLLRAQCHRCLLTHSASLSPPPPPWLVPLSSSFFFFFTCHTDSSPQFHQVAWG